jgi:P pilus assembly chaperone PapD
LPIALDNDAANRSGLKLMVKYLAALYVRPTEPAAVLSATINAETRAGEKVAVIKVSNAGNAHVVLQAPMLQVSVNGSEVAYSPEQREAVHGKNVLAGVERELIVPWSPALNAGRLAVTLKPPKSAP